MQRDEVLKTDPSRSYTHSPAQDAHPNKEDHGYRPDIDGLRSVAVVAVVLFHAWPALLPGGFIGVDVFFVISGFLISGLIFRALERDRFRLRDFYARRIRRIFPALGVTLAAVLLIGWLVLLEAEFRVLGKHVFGGAAFVSNLLLWQEAGYFDTSEALKPLLHLWSLGIEEQYYLIWPAMLVIAWKRRWKPLSVVLLVGTVSFAWNVLLVERDRVSAFYLPQTRFWELMLGSLLASMSLGARGSGSGRGVAQRLRSLSEQASSDRFRDSITVVGMLLIAAALAMLNGARSFPGWWALLPTLGCLAIIAAGPRAWLNRTVLSSRPFVYVGLISYPLYLWHWPLLSFLRIIRPSDVPHHLLAVAVAVAFVLAALTYRWIERPIRVIEIARPMRFIGVGVAAMAGFAVVGLAAAVDAIPPMPSAGMKAAVTARRTESIARGRYVARSCADLSSIGAEALPFCASYGDSSSSTIVVLWGDSHAQAWLPVFADVSRGHGVRLLMFGALGCPPLVGVRRTDGVGGAEHCSTFREARAVLGAIGRIAPAHIFLVARWSVYANGRVRPDQFERATHFLTTDSTGEATAETSRRALRSALPATVASLTGVAPVTIFRTLPTLRLAVYTGLARDPERLEPSIAEHRKTEAVPDQIIDSLPRSRLDVFDPAAITCTDRCRAVLGDVVLYTDDNHISAGGSLLFKQQVAARIGSMRRTGLDGL